MWSSKPFVSEMETLIRSINTLTKNRKPQQNSVKKLTSKSQAKDGIVTSWNLVLFVYSFF